MHPAAVITLHTFMPAYGLESLSPFCMKVEVYLKLRGLPYRTSLGNPRGGPKQKVPYVDLEDGTRLCDSETILAHFEKTNPRPIDAGLSDLDLACAHLIRRTVEEGFYFVALWARWCTEPGWKAMQPLFRAIPQPVRLLVRPMVRKKIRAQALAQGTGRHSPEEIYEMGRRDLHAVTKHLDGKPFLLGNEPRLVDLSVYSFFANVIKPDIDIPLREIARTTPGLPEYVDRMAAYVEKNATRPT